MNSFEIVCEIAPPSRPDLRPIAAQVDAMAGVASRFVVPDNHLGRATLSSVAVAAEVARRGVPTIVCLNARDRNTLGLRRDLLTAASHGLTDVLCVWGDDPTAGRRTDDLTVRSMIEEIRAYGATSRFEGCAPFHAGVAVRPERVPAWKSDADFWFVQVSFDIAGLRRWRDTTRVSAPVYAAVLVLRSAASAQSIPGLTIPTNVLDRIACDPRAGVELASEQVDIIRDHGGFAGVHVIPVGRHRELAAALRRGAATRHALSSPRHPEPILGTGQPCTFVAGRTSADRMGCCPILHPSEPSQYDLRSS